VSPFLLWWAKHDRAAGGTLSPQMLSVLQREEDIAPVVFPPQPDLAGDAAGGKGDEGQGEQASNFKALFQRARRLQAEGKFAAAFQAFDYITNMPLDSSSGVAVAQ
jgi:hypothetical protein